MSIALTKAKNRTRLKSQCLKQYQAGRVKVPTAKVGDVNIYYEVHGKGQALVLVMGLGGSSAWWFRQVPAFSQQYRVVAFDNRGTGRSDKPDAPYTMEMMAADVDGLLENIGIKVAHIFGVSMGGMIAQHFALNYPQKVASLILGCTTCGGSHSIIADAEAISALSDIERMQRQTPEERTREMLPLLWSQEFINKNESFVEQFIAKVTEYVTPLHGYIRQVEAIMEHDTYERLPKIKVPTLVIAGDSDKLVPVENSRLLASRIPNAELVILKNMGHGFNIEAEDATNKTILRFLKRHRRSR
jgi:pimeloyl-ACP methyl ester carboxylesterase